MKTQKRFTRTFKILSILLSLVLVFTFIVPDTLIPFQGIQTAEAKTKKVKYSTNEKLGAYGLILLDDILKDPTSLKIYNIYSLHATDYPNDSDGKNIVVIDYSATNSYGGRERSYLRIFTYDSIEDADYSIDTNTSLGYAILYDGDKPTGDKKKSISIKHVKAEKKILEKKSPEIIYPVW